MRVRRRPAFRLRRWPAAGPPEVAGGAATHIWRVSALLAARWHQMLISPPQNRAARSLAGSVRFRTSQRRPNAPAGFPVARGVEQLLDATAMRLDEYESLIAQALRNHPGLTRAEAAEILRELGGVFEPPPPAPPPPAPPPPACK